MCENQGPTYSQSAIARLKSGPDTKQSPWPYGVPALGWFAKFALDLLFLFSYSGWHACSVFPQVLRGLLQEVRPRRVVRNGRLPCQLHICGLFAMRRETEISAVGSDPWPAAFCCQAKAHCRPSYISRDNKTRPCRGSIGRTPRANGCRPRALISLPRTSI